MFIKRLKIDGNFYIYDININQIVRVDKIIYDILPFIDGNGTLELPDSIKTNYNKKEMTTALKEIDNFNKTRNLFHAYKKRRVKIPTIREVKEISNNHIHHVILNITEQCNMRCKYCSYGTNYPYERDHKNSDMKWPIAKAAVDLLFNNSSGNNDVVLGFYGGEPLLAFKMIEKTVDYAKNQSRKYDKNVRFAITTNGTLLSDEVIKFFVDNNFNMLISIDGPQHIHDRNRINRQGKGTWYKVMEGLKKIKSNYPQFFQKKLGYSSMITPPFDLLHIRDFFNNFEFSTTGPLNLNLPNLDDTTYYKNFPNSMWEEYREQRKELENILFNFLDNNKNPDHFLTEFLLKKAYSAFHNRFTGESDFMPLNGCCFPGQQRTFISTDGAIGPCEKIGNRINLGNVWKGFDIHTIHDLMNVYAETCKECTTCWLNRNCSLCFLSILRPEEKNKWVIDPTRKIKLCKNKQKTSTDRLRLYIKIISKMPHIFDYFATNDYFDNINKTKGVMNES